MQKFGGTKSILVFSEVAYCFAKIQRFFRWPMNVGTCETRLANAKSSKTVNVMSAGRRTLTHVALLNI